MREDEPKRYFPSREHLCEGGKGATELKVIASNDNNNYFTGAVEFYAGKNG